MLAYIFFVFPHVKIFPDPPVGDFKPANTTEAFRKTVGIPDVELT